MLQVVYPNPVEDEDVNQINLHKIIGEMAQYIIHHPNEICWEIHQVKGHH
jgi:hypothetical protein